MSTKPKKVSEMAVALAYVRDMAARDLLGIINRTIDLYGEHVTPYAKERVRLAKVALAAVRRAVKEKK